MIKKIFLIFFLFAAGIGFSQEKSIKTLTAYPNPFYYNTKITFLSDTISEITFNVKNVLGKTVYTKKIKTTKGKNTLPFYKGDLAAGIYIYSIRSTKNSISKRLIIR